MNIKFGYCVEAPIEWTELLALARELDANSRFDYFWIADSLFANGPADEPKLEAWTALAAVAQAMSRLRIGVLVSGNAYRNPSLLAKIVTTIDRISGGRVELGIGAGWPGENRRYGIDFWRRKERAERLVEALEVIKLLWTQPRPQFEGKYYRLDAPPYSPPNVQRPHPPILVGGGSEPILRAMARFADAASPMIEPKLAFAKIDAYCREIGRDPGEIRRTGGGQLFLHDVPAVQRIAIDFAVKQYGTTEEQVRSGLFGSAEDVRHGVQRQVEDGIGEIHVFQLPRVHIKSILRFSDEVIPAFA